MKNLITSIENFKQVYRNHYVETMQKSIPQLSFYKPFYEFKNQAEEKDIHLFENEIAQKLPSELKAFYTEIGQLIDENEEEILNIFIPCLKDLLSKKGNEKWTKTPSFGLVDMMKLHWGNDRYELNEDEFFTAEQIKTLNENYTCIGYWCKEPFYEEAYFIVFDQKHQFAEIRYNQDKFGQLQTQLLDILETGIPEQSFEELMISVFGRLEKHTIVFAENW